MYKNTPSSDNITNKRILSLINYPSTRILYIKNVKFLKILQKKTQKGKKYFGCEDNPNCRFMTWDMPTAEVCPNCQSSLFRKGGAKGKLVCHKPDCGYEKDL